MSETTPPLDSQHLMNNYQRLPVSFARGEGPWLYDQAGNAYLDAICGIGVTGLGHCHPEITQAIVEQAQRLLHTSNIYHIENQTRLADALCELSGMDKAFFCNSGAEANEAALKIARIYGHQKGVEVPTTLVMEQAFHGRTLATVSATANGKAQEGLAPLVEGFIRVPFDDVQAIEQALAEHPNIVAILVEPIQGEGGLGTPQAGYLQQLRQLSDRHGLLLMIDEIQSGNSRTGTYFAYQQDNILPDVVTTAKGLGNGIPIGACLAQGKAAEIFQPGSHGSTYGGNPFACAAALAVVRLHQREQLWLRAAQLGQRLHQGLQEAFAGRPEVREVRGKGLMIGIELDRPCGALVGQALAQGLLINVTAGQVVRLLPPLILSDAQADQLLNQVVSLVGAFLDA